jgi:hypothetical protein
LAAKVEERVLLLVEVEALVEVQKVVDCPAVEVEEPMDYHLT